MTSRSIRRPRLFAPALSRRAFVALGAAATLPIPHLRAEVQERAIDIENMLPGDFAWHPERAPDGPVAVIASIPEQRVHVYRNGVRIGVSTCSTGRKGHATPTGVFTVLQKDRDHRSSTYGGAPMPNMNRLTWDGIALHAGNLPGYPASHGCVRLPMEFSKLLFGVTHIGTPVIIAGSKSDPWELIHPGLLLGQSSEAELEDAVAALDAKHHPADWAEGEQPYPITTLLVTGADATATLMEDGREVMVDRLVDFDGGPVGEHVITVQGSAEGGMRWVGLTHHPDPENPAAPEAAILDRLRIPDAMMAEFRRRIHPGLTVVVSDLPQTPDRRSGTDFVIMDGELLASPLPRLPGDPQRQGDTATDRG